MQRERVGMCLQHYIDPGNNFKGLSREAGPGKSSCSDDCLPYQQGWQWTLIVAVDAQISKTKHKQ